MGVRKVENFPNKAQTVTIEVYLKFELFSFFNDDDDDDFLNTYFLFRSVWSKN
jgi:hypothetical protein